MRGGRLLCLAVVGVAAAGVAQLAGPLPKVKFKQKPDAGLSVKRPPLESKLRLQKALQADPETADMLRVVAQALAEGMENGGGPAGRLAQNALRRHPGADREALRKFIADVGSVETPPNARTRSLRVGDVSSPLSESVLANVRGSYLRGVGRGMQRGPAINPNVVRAGLKLSKELVERLNHPCITKIDPRSSQGYRAGQRLSFYGWKFSPDRAGNSLVLMKVLGNGSLGERARFAPAVSSESAMEAVLPGDLEPGQYQLKVVVKRGGLIDESPLVLLPIQSPPPPEPALASLSPGTLTPGREAVATGANYTKQINRLAFVMLAPMEGQELPFSVKVDGKDCLSVMGKVLNDTQLSFALPRVMQPGRYRLAVHVGGVFSPWVVVDVSPLQYRVRFTQIHCLDESDPEWAGHDEVFTAWCIVADGVARAKSVGDHTEYYNWDDGDWDRYYPDDQNVFPEGDNGSVRQALAISTSLFEWDAGDMKKVNEVIGVISEVTQAILKYTGDVEWAELVKALTPVVQKLVTWFGGNPDPLGTQFVGWSAMDLAALTDNPERKFGGKLSFLNNDDTGSYEVFFEVSEKL
jgi:hypothetical protein